MLPQQKALVQETWNLVVPIADQAATMFYDRLFEIDPDLRKLFTHVDLTSQCKKLIQAITTVVGALETVEEVVPQLEQLGRRHSDYGVEDAHYQTVGNALLWTLEKGLGDQWTPEAKASWTAAYMLIASVMQGASRGNPKRDPAVVAA